MNINHISVSRKKCHDLCEAQYKFRYHLELKPSGPEPFYFTYGTLVHRAAELYVKNKAKKPISEIAKEIVEGKIPLENERFCPPLPEEFEKKLAKHLKSIQKLTERIGLEGEVEYEFKYDLDPPNKRNVTGFIDRLIIKDDKAFIIDYKTTKKGKWRVNSETVVDDLQLRCYARVVHRNFNIKPENIKCALFYLEGENLVGAQFSEAALLETENELRQAYFKIEQSDPDKVWGRVSWHCKRCDFASICPFYKPQGTSDKWDGDLVQLGHDGWEN